MKLIDLSEKDRYIIAEFIYSYKLDILIKDDVKRVIKVFKNHNVKEAYNIKLIAFDVLNLIVDNLTDKERDIIMSEYYRKYA